MSLRIAERNKRVVVASGAVGRRGAVLAANRRDGEAVDYYEGPACRTRNRKKRKLGPIDDDPISDSDDDDVVSSVQLLEETIGPADSEMPEKLVLELVLDILQRCNIIYLSIVSTKKHNVCFSKLYVFLHYSLC